MSKLDDFKVEELEQRLEMGRWSAGASGGGTGGIKLHVYARHTIYF